MTTELLLPDGAVHSAKHQAARECNHLWRCALGVLPHAGHAEDGAAGLAAQYVATLEARAASAGLNIDFLRAFYCAACRTPFLPGVSCKVRVHARGAHSRVQTALRRRRKRRRSDDSGSTLNSTTEEHSGPVKVTLPAQEVAYTCFACESAVMIAAGTQKQKGIKLSKQEKERAQRRRQRVADAAVASARKTKANAQTRALEGGQERKRKLNKGEAGAGASSLRPVIAPVPATFIGEHDGRSKKKRKKKKAEGGSSGGLSKFLGSL